MASVVILGAGLTGIATAYHLEQQGFYDYVIFEKEATAGGLCRSLHQDGFTFDFTGHLLHLSDTSARDLVMKTVGQETFATISRRSRIYSHETYTHYPYQINLHGLPSEVIVACIEGFVQRPRYETSPTHFTDWVMASFGAGFAEHFFYPYQEKIFDIPVAELSASWTGRFVPATSLREMLYGSLRPSDDVVGYNAQFLYPHQGGIITWVTGLARHLKNPIQLTHTAVHIDGTRKVVRFSNGREEPYEQLVSTLPLDTLLGNFTERPDTSLAQARSHLRCNSVLNINIGVNRPELVPAHWVYYPEKAYPFYRVGFPSELVPSMAPAGMSSLSAECSALNRSYEEQNAKIEATRNALYKLFQLSASDVATECLITIPHAYVIFDQWRDEHLPGILTTLANSYNIQSVGRYGAWKYASMQESLLDGRDTAINLLRKV